MLVEVAVKAGRWGQKLSFHWIWFMSAMIPSLASSGLSSGSLQQHPLSIGPLGRLEYSPTLPDWSMWVSFGTRHLRKNNFLRWNFRVELLFNSRQFIVFIRILAVYIHISRRMIRRSTGYAEPLFLINLLQHLPDVLALPAISAHSNI